MSDPLLPILEVFAELKRSDSLPQGDRAFSARPFPGCPQHRIALDAKGAPVFLLQSSDHSHRPATQLAYLSVRHAVSCEVIHVDGITETVLFSTVRFVGDDPLLHEYFLRVVGGAVVGLPSSPSGRNIDHMVLRLAELFNALSQAPRQSAQGLWGEVFVIACASDTVAAVQAWRQTPEDTFDFSTGEEHAEVKSTLSEVREHHFSLNQLRPEGGDEVTVISLLLRQSETGQSLGELITKVRARVAHDPDTRMRFDRSVAVTLGNTLDAALRVRFDAQYAQLHLRLFSARDIPCVGLPLPPEISSVRFAVDMSQVASTIAPSSLPSLDAVLAPLRPARPSI